MPNFIAERDPVTGRIVRNNMTPEDQKTMSQLGVEASRNKTKQAHKLLKDLTGKNWEENEASLQLLATDAAKGTVAAHRLLLQRLGQLKETSTPGVNWDPESGLPCPTCGSDRIIIFVGASAEERVEFLLSAKATKEAAREQAAITEAQVEVDDLSDRTGDMD
jgi:hypothetical protein